MTDLEEHRIWINVKRIIREHLSLMEDKADDGVIDERIRADIQMKGSNLWILMFAILVASIGLNVNSTAVIIGAMLISPLMGPIMGIGYGAGINDFTLIRRAFKNLAIATFIALITSTLYFLISPLQTVQSELLARTTPTAWDVLIGFFGGLAGAVGVTRKEKSNVIPGVAIATALMPPLCTAGFGLATGHWNYFFGAFYLYTINFVFIGLSAFLIVRLFNIAEKKYVDPEVAKKAQRYIIIVSVLTMLPSSYLAYRLVEEELFRSKASAFVDTQLNFPNTNVAQVKIDPSAKEIKVFLIGEHVDEKRLKEITLQMSNLGLAKANLKVYQNGERENLDVSTLKADIVSDLYENAKKEIDVREQEIIELKEKLNRVGYIREFDAEIPKELEMLFPKVHNVILSHSIDSTAEDRNVSETRLILNADSKQKLSYDERMKIEKWLKIRTKSDNVLLIFR